ncbi:hypothetical protein C8J57DRAFT_1290590 [Mycena rebaudengoi]|nr:hypothetical protein C8J57DRAFT_1290590 [Mycena rebaudengoi]
MSYVAPIQQSPRRNPFLDPIVLDSAHPQQPSVPSIKEYTYSLFNKIEQPWAVLSLLGDTEYSKSAPAFAEGSNVTGEVRLDLESGDPIHSVVLSLRGSIITGATPSEIFPFLELPTTLWSRSMGDPRNPQAMTGDKWTQKLRGKYVWPFSISVPSQVSLRDEVFRLPQTFFERHTRARIEYEITVRFIRTKLRSDHRLTATLYYMPISRPAPPSRLRQFAYQHNTALLGPDSDPEGWQTFPSVRARGRLIGSGPIDAKCILSLAKPLCYTRGTVIPCGLVIECGDSQVLELLSAPDAPVARLRRAVRFHTGEKAAANSGDVPHQYVWKEELDHSELATWWPAADRTLELDSTDEIALNSFRRLLKGEIHLRHDLITSSSIANFRIEYSVVLFPFGPSGYESFDSEPLLIEPVEIASEFASGPRPLAYSTPTVIGI